MMKRSKKSTTTTKQLGPSPNLKLIVPHYLRTASFLIKPCDFGECRLHVTYSKRLARRGENKSCWGPRRRYLPSRSSSMQIGNTLVRIISHVSYPATICKGVQHKNKNKMSLILIRHVLMHAGGSVTQGETSCHRGMEELAQSVHAKTFSPNDSSSIWSPNKFWRLGSTLEQLAQELAQLNSFFPRTDSVSGSWLHVAAKKASISAGCQLLSAAWAINLPKLGVQKPCANWAVQTKKRIRISGEVKLRGKRAVSCRVALFLGLHATCQGKHSCPLKIVGFPGDTQIGRDWRSASCSPRTNTWMKYKNWQITNLK